MCSGAVWWFWGISGVGSFKEELGELMKESVNVWVVDCIKKVFVEEAGDDFWIFNLINW